MVLTYWNYKYSGSNTFHEFNKYNNHRTFLTTVCMTWGYRKIWKLVHIPHFSVLKIFYEKELRRSVQVFVIFYVCITKWYDLQYCKFVEFMKPGDTYTVERCVLMFLSAFDSTATEIEKKKFWQCSIVVEPIFVSKNTWEWSKGCQITKKPFSIG